MILSDSLLLSAKSAHNTLHIGSVEVCPCGLSTIGDIGINPTDCQLFFSLRSHQSNLFSHTLQTHINNLTEASKSRKAHLIITFLFQLKICRNFAIMIKSSSIKRKSRFGFALIFLQFDKMWLWQLSGKVSEDKSLFKRRKIE